MSQRLTEANDYQSLERGEDMHVEVHHVHHVHHVHVNTEHHWQAGVDRGWVPILSSWCKCLFISYAPQKGRG